jgi:type II secretory pathway component PulF
MVVLGRGWDVRSQKHPMIPQASQKSLFYSEMTKLLEAGFGIREAAGVMSEIGLSRAQARWVKELNHGLDQGKSIAEALGGNRESVSDIERSIIGAGERGGRLAPAMRHLADYFAMLAAARRETLKSLVHPVIVLHLGIFIGTVPTAMIDGRKTHAEIVGGFLATLLVAYAIAFIAGMGIQAVLRAARRNARIDALIRRIPRVGKVRTHLAMAGFCKVYHTCLLAGIPMRETVRMAADASQSGAIRAAAMRLEKSVAEGNAIGPRMVAEAAFPKAFARIYSTGEAAGTLDKDLANWSRVFQEESESGVMTLAAALPRLLYFLFLGFTAWKIVGFFNSYYGGLLESLN